MATDQEMVCVCINACLCITIKNRKHLFPWLHLYCFSISCFCKCFLFLNLVCEVGMWKWDGGIGTFIQRDSAQLYLVTASLPTLWHGITGEVPVLSCRLKEFAFSQIMWFDLCFYIITIIHLALLAHPVTLVHLSKNPCKRSNAGAGSLPGHEKRSTPDFKIKPGCEWLCTLFQVF